MKLIADLTRTAAQSTAYSLLNCLESALAVTGKPPTSAT